MGAEITSRGFTQPGSLNHGKSKPRPALQAPLSTWLVPLTHP